MSQTFLLIALLSLAGLSLGAIALMAHFSAGRDSESATNAGDPQVVDQITLARQRRTFLRRYPEWASKDFQNDRSSPWFTDPEFSRLRDSNPLHPGRIR